MVVGSVRQLATEANVRHVKSRVEEYVADGAYGFADFPQSRALPRLTFILEAQQFPITNDLHREWWQEIVSRRPFVGERARHKMP